MPFLCSSQYFLTRDGPSIIWFNVPLDIS